MFIRTGRSETVVNIDLALVIFVHIEVRGVCLNSLSGNVRTTVKCNARVQDPGLQNTTALEFNLAFIVGKALLPTVAE